MRRRAPVAVTLVFAVAAVPATVATAQSPVVGTEQRLPDPAWTGAPALAPTPLTTPAALLDLVDQTADLLNSNGAVNRNYTRWAIPSEVNYNDAIQSLKDFLQYRAQWMDGEINAF